VGHQISVSFEIFYVVQALLYFFYKILADSLEIYFINKVDFNWDTNNQKNDQISKFDST
jgi:hypothetical protein